MPSAASLPHADRDIARADRLVAVERNVLRAAVELLRRRLANLVLQAGRGLDDGRAAHHDRARAVRAVALPHVAGRAVIDAADALHRQFERIGGDLREHRLDALPDRRRADIDRDRAVGLELEPHVLARAGAAALEVATDADAVIAAVDQPALQRRLLAPAEFGEAAVERHAIIAAVGCGLDLERHHPGQRIGISDSAIRLRRRNSTRSSARSCAAMSNSRSRKKSASNRPGPR